MPGSNVFSYEYDAAGQISGRTFPGSGGQKVSYTYLPGGLLSTVRAPFLHQANPIYAYDAAERLTKMVLPNDTTANYTFDGAGRLSRVTNKTPGGSTISDHQYTDIDGAGNRKTVVETNGSFSGAVNFTYDALNRLFTSIYPNNQSLDHRRVDYTYNDSGDRLTATRYSSADTSAQVSSTGYSYDANTGRMTAAGGANYCYDSNGNQTRRCGSSCSSGGDAFTYNVENHMTQAVVGGTTTAYTYNGDGVRTKKQITGGSTTDYYQDINGKLPVVAAEKVSSDWTYYVYGKNLIAKRESAGTPKYYHYDGSGNVRAITDATGAVVERYDYDAFGSLRSTAPSGSPNDRRFSGEQNDAETGLVFLRARYYDPAIGRFISKDPGHPTAARPQSLNQYSYAENNPVGLSTLFRNFGDVFSRQGLSSMAKVGRSRVQAREQVGEVGASEPPLERLRDALVAFLKTEQAVIDLRQTGEVIRGQHLALHHREVDLDLVQPTRVHRQVHWDKRGPRRLQTFRRTRATMG